MLDAGWSCQELYLSHLQISLLAFGLSVVEDIVLTSIRAICGKLVRACLAVINIAWT